MRVRSCNDRTAASNRRKRNQEVRSTLERRPPKALATHGGCAADRGQARVALTASLEHASAFYHHHL
ncbi:hypothetical protein DF3PB_960006 [uncultured Defluviicoccus sp.]|uniref:Uncharacterized protein n=1 Tax=metagenome TaxID=256318 RepID=A0A380TMF1_9ZZZZ|nr:hypothetical protein DF3PB_960006 [uncultured Defluviicoccus sp.]